ncbi:putative Aflatoxin biosynthesis ketoreductase nor-1 [Glarea lozoyensis 74030]|uniref:Putative Aflatoxin biosynthesis ketoreductase nor-1 n=1 Tax=Glarea lozoyensis (strain ATCC 74030 / MF5533) TaxID=1104152 RepID=H0EIR9_GLAL7|nr:putative Aflatoxin biosynthesis ketoreductase nor-1 [Glarea lozoyensis 74030]
MPPNTTYLVTGANRGIGHALAAALLLRPHTTVIGTLRPSASASSLQALSTAEGSTLIITPLEISASSASAIESATQSLHDHLLTQGVSSIDVLIASAGLGTAFHATKDTALEDVTAHFHINTLGPLSLYQSLRPLLLASTQKKFIVISSSLGSIQDMEDAAPTLAYGVSKAGVNYVVRKVHFEEDEVVGLAVHPGIGYETPPMGLGESVEGVLRQIDGATKETSSGTFVSYDGSKIAW